MLYHIFKPFLKLTTRFFFRNYQVNGLENIPKNGPFIFASNHPATFMDPVIIAITIKQKVHFLSKSTVFKTSFSKWLFARLGMIPVYRKQDDPVQLGKNDQMFSKCFEHLRKGGNLLIFPEGISLPERKLKEIKSGAARIAFGAEDLNNFELDIKIVCIGINYSDNGRFQSNVLINIEKPISVKEYKERYQADSFKAVRDLTIAIKEKLEHITVSVQEAEGDELVRRSEEVYKTQIMDEMGIPKKDKTNDFRVTKSMVGYLNYFKINAPWKLHFIKQKVDAYFAELDRIGVSDSHIRKLISGKNILTETVLRFMYFILAFPLFVAGFITNYLPYYFSGLLAKKITPYLEYRVAIAMVGGMFLFIINYILLGWLCNSMFHILWLNWLVVLSLPLLGLFAFRYHLFFIKTIKRWRLFTFFYKNNAYIIKLLSMRNELISGFETLRMEFETAEKAII
jgi:glycerol-3-phosphate O-acyltransferase/dihydroxyacetone phosphate acyltransferase